MSTADESAATATAPPVIQAYLDAAAASDYDALVACFTSDATVHDDGRTYRGRAQIRAWREEVASAFEYTVDVLDAAETGAAQYRVTARIAGSFPGSPVDLQYRFALVGDLIEQLEIAP